MGNSEFPWLKVSRQRRSSEIWWSPLAWNFESRRETLNSPCVGSVYTSSTSWALWWDINCHFTLTFSLELVMDYCIAGNFRQRKISSKAIVRQFVRNLFSSNIGRRSFALRSFYCLSFIFAFMNNSDPTRGFVEKFTVIAEIFVRDLISYFSYFWVKVQNFVACENHACIPGYVTPPLQYKNL